MSDIPEEIRKMFPNMPIHKLDIDDNGELHILASAEPLSNEPDFENMPIEQVNQYLRDHGYDPEHVKINGKILTDALIENIHLLARAEAAEQKLSELQAEIERLREALNDAGNAIAKVVACCTYVSEEQAKFGAYGISHEAFTLIDAFIRKHGDLLNTLEGGE